MKSLYKWSAVYCCENVVMCSLTKTNEGFLTKEKKTENATDCMRSTIRMYKVMLFETEPM